MDVIVRKRQMERDDALFEIELAERKQRLTQMSAEAQVKLERDVNQTLRERMEMYQSLCPNEEIDDRARLMFKDNLLNITSQSAFAASASSQLAIGNGSVSNASPKPLTISTVATEMGYRLSTKKSQEIGKRMAAWYRVEYGEEPATHEQYVDGAVRPVKSYTERDRDTLENVIKRVMEEK